MSVEQIDAYYKIYELNYSNKINDSFIKGLISIYSGVVNKVLPIDDVQTLHEDLSNDYILTNELKNITGSIAATCGKLMSLFSLTFITIRHIKVKPKELDKELDNELVKELDKEH